MKRFESVPMAEDGEAEEEAEEKAVNVEEADLDAAERLVGKDIARTLMRKLRTSYLLIQLAAARTFIRAISNQLLLRQKLHSGHQKPPERYDPSAG